MSRIVLLRPSVEPLRCQLFLPPNYSDRCSSYLRDKRYL